MQLKFYASPSSHFSSDLFSGSFSGESKTLAKAISSMNVVLLIKEQPFRSTPVSTVLQNDELKVIIMPKRHIMQSIFWSYTDWEIVL